MKARIRQIDRKLFLAVATRNGYNGLYLKALAFAIKIKYETGTSVVKDWNYNKLSKIAGVSPATAKKYVHALEELGRPVLSEEVDIRLVRRSTKNGHNYITFLPLRSKKVLNRFQPHPDHKEYHERRARKMDIGRIDLSSVKSISLGLKALVIRETISNKMFAKQLTSSKHNPYVRASERKSATKQCRKRGYGESYEEWGLTYEYLSKKIGCGYTVVSNAIKEGEKRHLFKKHKWSECSRANYDACARVENPERGRACFFVTTKQNKTYCITVYPNTYSLPRIRKHSARHSAPSNKIKLN